LSKRNYYVYAYRIDGDMAYVGKGTGKRAWEHLRRARNPILRQRIASANSVTVRVVSRGLTEPEAFRLERRCINKWRATLSNLTQGTRTQTEALWHDCLNDLQNNFISYGVAVVSTNGSRYDLQSGSIVADTIALRVRNLAWLKRQMRSIMRMLEAEDPSLI